MNRLGSYHSSTLRIGERGGLFANTGSAAKTLAQNPKQASPFEDYLYPGLKVVFHSGMKFFFI